MARKVLNVGGNSKAIPLPSQYEGFEHLLLDIDPKGAPDVVCDARNMADELEPGQFDAVYCSHNLEHYYEHDVTRVLDGFIHVLKLEGFAHIRVPDIGGLIKLLAEKDLDIEDVIYRTRQNVPIRALDMLYGWQRQIRTSGVEYFAHKTGFTRQSLVRVLRNAGFTHVYHKAANLELTAIAFLEEPDQFSRKLWNIRTENKPEPRDPVTETVA